MRQNFLDEITEILRKQQKFGLEITDNDIDYLLYEKNKGLFYQRPFMTPELIEQLRGKCEYESDEPRAPKASYSFEIFRVAQDLSHLTYNGGNKLTKEQIAECLEKCKNTRKVNYRAIKNIIANPADDNFDFDYIRGPRTKYKKDPNDPTKKIIDEKFDELKDNTFAEMKFYHSVKKSLENLPGDWGKIENNIDLFDQIGYILTANKDDENVRKELDNLGQLSTGAIDALLPLNFSGFGHLSVKCLRKITPHLLKGMTYDQVIEAEYPGKFTAKLSGDRNKLPALTEEEKNELTNPIVKRAVSQTNKVINAIIAKYGSPYQIKLESAGELGKDFDTRRKIKDAQDENATVNEKIKERLINEFKVATPTGLQITKFKFYNEQNGVCPYCGERINLDQLFTDEHYCEIDHIIPFSMCGNDGKMNKVLVHNSHNQEKRNQTPFEAWGGDEKGWQKFTNTVASIWTNEKHPKRIRLLSETVPKEDWNARALNDTRYLEKFMTHRLTKYLKFFDDDGHHKKVITPTGFITKSLRQIYGIPKSREENNLHHAADACVIAVTSERTIRDYTEWNKLRGLHQSQRLVRPEPWPNFGKEVRLRTSELKGDRPIKEALNDWRDQFRDLYKNQSETFRKSIHPIFVSRMPKRNGTGPTNKETIRSPKRLDNNRRLIRKDLSRVTLKDLDNSNSVLLASDLVLYNQLKTLLEQNDDDPKKAFSEPVYKNNKQVDKNGRPLMPVSTIKVYSTDPDTSGFYINHGKAFVNNGSMVRVDIYKKPNSKGVIKHFIVPVYVHQIKIGTTRILPKTGGYENIDEGFEKVCSLYPNDYVRIYFNDRKVEGYYANYGINNGAIYLVGHSVARKDDKIWASPHSAIKIERLDISVLGDNYWGYL